MCRINFSINASDIDGTIDPVAEGRYRVKGSTGEYITFNIADINSAQTPDLTVIGEYELQVRVKDDLGEWSDWYGGLTDTFEIGINCSTSFSYQIAIADCTLTNPASLAWTTVYTDVDAINIGLGTILYSDANLTTIFPITANTDYRLRLLNSTLFDYTYTIDPITSEIIFRTNCNSAEGGANTPSGTLTISQTGPSLIGEGTLNISGGEPNEIITLAFNLTFNGPGETINRSISFSNPTVVPTLNPGNLNETDTVILDASGNFNCNYTITEGQINCNIQVVDRSFSYAIPTPDFVDIEMTTLVATS